MISSGQESCGTIEADLRYTGSYGGAKYRPFSNEGW